MLEWWESRACRYLAFMESPDNAIASLIDDLMGDARTSDRARFDARLKDALAEVCTGTRLVRLAICNKLTKIDAQMLNANREPGIWAPLMRNPGGELLPEAAEYLLWIRFADRDVDRMRQLAGRSETGELTDEERAEFDSHLHVANLLAVIQPKARLALRRR
jgi:hypothetical protein